MNPLSPNPERVPPGYALFAVRFTPGTSQGQAADDWHYLLEQLKETIRQDHVAYAESVGLAIPGDPINDLFLRNRHHDIRLCV